MILTNNEISDFGILNRSPDEEKELVKRTQDHRKISTDGGKAQVYVADNFASMTYFKNGIAVFDAGVLISGTDIHLGVEPSNLRLNTFWKFNDKLLSTLPSTIYTPIPVLVWDAPNLTKVIANKLFLLNSIVS